MGNRLTQEETNEREELLNKLIKIDVETLEIGDTEGHSGYIDFIHPNLLNNNNIMKGIDRYNRPFIVFKAEIILPNYTKIQTFTTFFQRFNDSKFTWHACGHHGLNLFDTCGGANNAQIKILYELLSNKTVSLDDIELDEIDNLKLLWRNSIKEEDYHELKYVYPVRINVGYNI